jgi:hypothetical protein
MFIHSHRDDDEGAGKVCTGTSFTVNYYYYSTKERPSWSFVVVDDDDVVVESSIVVSIGRTTNKPLVMLPKGTKASQSLVATTCIKERE